MVNLLLVVLLSLFGMFHHPSSAYYTHHNYQEEVEPVAEESDQLCRKCIQLVAEVAVAQLEGELIRAREVPDCLRRECLELPTPFVDDRLCSQFLAFGGSILIQIWADGGALVPSNVCAAARFCPMRKRRHIVHQQKRALSTVPAFLPPTIVPSYPENPKEVVLLPSTSIRRSALIPASIGVAPPLPSPLIRLLSNNIDLEQSSVQDDLEAMELNSLLSSSSLALQQRLFRRPAALPLLPAIRTFPFARYQKNSFGFVNAAPEASNIVVQQQQQPARILEYNTQPIVGLRKLFFPAMSVQQGQVQCVRCEEIQQE